MPLDDIDRKLAQAAARASIVPAARLGELSQRAEREQTTLARVLLSEAGPNRDAALGILRSLHAGFAAHEEDALDRHEDRLIARLALRVNALDEAAARAALAEQEARRAQGHLSRLGEVLVEQSAIDAATAERLYRQFENAAVVCRDCFAPNARNRLPEGATLECPRCGAVSPVPPPAVKPGWTLPGPADVPSDVVYRQASALVGEEAVETAPVEDAAPARTASGRNKPLAPQKRRRPNLAPEKKASKLVAVLAIAGVVLVFAAIVVVWKVVQPGEGEVRYGKFAELVKVAREKKTGGAIEESARTYAAAFDLFKDVAAPKERDAVLAEARKELEACSDFAKRTAKLAEGDAGPLCELAKTAEDKEILSAVVERLSRAKGAAAGAGLVALADSKDPEIRHAAIRAALDRGGVAALPLIEKILRADEDPLQKEAVVALLRIEDKAAIPTIGTALERFPKQDGLWLNAAQLLASMKDPAAVPLLKKLAKDPRAQVSDAAIAGLVRLSPQDAVPELVAGLDGGEALARACGEQLEKMGDSAVTALAAALANGQTSAAGPLIASTSPRALAAVTDTLPKLAWEKRGALLELLSNRITAASRMTSSIAAIIQEARDGLRKKDPKLTRTVLQQVVLAAKSFGFPDAAQEIKLELRFIELADRSPLPIDGKNLDVTDLENPSGDPRLELHNFTEVRLVLYARGPESVELHAVSNTESGRVLTPGKYEVWVARIADDGREVDPARAILDLAPGKVTAVEYGSRPDPDETTRSTLAGRRKSDAPGAEDSESDRRRRDFERGFRAEQLLEESRKKLAERLKAESPWPRAQESEAKTAHYRVVTDAGADAAKRVGAELEKAYSAYAAVLSVPAEPPPAAFAVRFFKQRADYEKWRAFTSLSAIFTEQLAKDRKLPARSRALAQKVKGIDTQAAARLEQLADALEKAQGVDDLEVESLEELDDELARAERATDPVLVARALQRAFYVARGAEIVEAAAGRSPHAAILAHYDHASRELCLFDVAGWERALRHEAWHQFLAAQAAKAPPWLREGLAVHFEDPGGKGEERLAELKKAHEASSVLDGLRVSGVLATERLAAIDYALSWSLVDYLVKDEPATLAKIVAAAREGRASTFGVVSAFDDLQKSEESWQKRTRKLVLGQ